MAPRELVEQEVRAFLRAHAPSATEHPREAPLSDVVDSLRLLELVSYLEARLSVRVAPLDLTPNNFATIARIVAFVAAKRTGSPDA